MRAWSSNSVRVVWLVAIVVVVTAGVLRPVAAVAATFSEFEGRWTGWGVMRLDTGEVERIKCIATYTVGSGGASLGQDLRCASKSIRIDSHARIVRDGTSVSGDWRETVFDVMGGIGGTAVPRGFELVIDGPNFSADMTVTVSGCRQSLSIAPHGFRVDKISIGLSRC